MPNTALASRKTAKTVHISALFFLLFCVPVRSFCPSGCHCDDVKLSVYCVSAKLDIVPILLNPGTTGLDLSYNIIQNINPGFAFYRSLTTLNLSNNVIGSLGSSNFASQNNLQNLILNNNKLSKIRAHTFSGLLQLTSLDLSQNFIQQIENNSFRSLQNLDSLDLSFNSLALLDGEIFANLVSLRKLNLCNNNIRNITSGVFTHVKSLRELNVCSNSITFIENGAFVNQAALQHLILGQNNLHELEVNSFLGLHSLRSIDLQSNKLENVSAFALKHLLQLESLILSNNNFESIPDKAFEEVHSLRNLYISNNQKLGRIAHNAFVNLNNIQYMEISYNPKLKYLHSNLFASLIHLRHLILRGNHLSSLSKEMINHSLILTLDLRENPLECNCSLKWLNSLLKNHNSSVQIEDIKCSFPDNLSSRRLIDLNEYDLKCYSHILFIVSTASAVLVLLILVVIASYFYLTKCKKMKSIVQDTWPEKIVTTWNGIKQDKQLHDEEYTFQARQTFAPTRPPVLWPDISGSATRDDFSSDAYASTAASTPQDEYKDYRDPVFVSMTANKIKNKFCSPNPNKYRSITRSYTDSSSSIKDFANSSREFSNSFVSKSDFSRDSSSSFVCGSPYSQQIFSIASGGANPLPHFPTDHDPTYQSWKCFEPKILSRSEDILGKDLCTLPNQNGALHTSRTLRQNGVPGKRPSSSNDRMLTLSHLYALPKRPNFGYEHDNIYDNII